MALMLMKRRPGFADSVKLHLRVERTYGRTDRDTSLSVVSVRGVHPMGNNRDDS